MRSPLLLLALVGCTDTRKILPAEELATALAIRHPMFGRDGTLYWYARDSDARSLLRRSPEGAEAVIDRGNEIATIVPGDDGIVVTMGPGYDGGIRMYRYDGTVTDYPTPTYSESRAISNGSGSILFEGRGEEAYWVARLDLASGTIERRFGLNQGRLLRRIEERYVKPGWLTDESWAVSGFVSETGGAYLVSFDNRGLRSVSVGPWGIRSPQGFAFDDETGDIYWADGGYTGDETRIYRGNYTLVASLRPAARDRHGVDLGPPLDHDGAGERGNPVGPRWRRAREFLARLRARGNARARRRARDSNRCKGGGRRRTIGQAASALNHQILALSAAYCTQRRE
ncbi:hypothetical protein BH11MYX3_BH11MYX3_21460 [soil metagenome]